MLFKDILKQNRMPLDATHVAINSKIVAYFSTTLASFGVQIADLST